MKKQKILKRQKESCKRDSEEEPELASQNQKVNKKKKCFTDVKKKGCF